MYSQFQLDVNSIELKAKDLITSYINSINKIDYPVSVIEKKQYNFEVTVSGKSDQIKVLVYFGKKGIKTVLQGNVDSKIYHEINNLLFGEKLSLNSLDDFSEPENYIGTDESGKGDYFGPLVICGVFADKKNLAELKKIGVKDSKELSDNLIKKISLEIKEIIGNKFSIIIITPEKYNQLHEKMKNVNRILGWAHAKVLENLLEKFETGEAISDKFGDENYIRNSLQGKGKNILLHQYTKAERYTAVAAASILAREKFCNWFDVQKNKYGLELPKGASSKVDNEARSIKEKFGYEKLNELVKLHFKTTLKII
ncbi:MAG: ribonuclease HIII [Bacteroidetes bacterium]|nr:ribonuclease HIII [Bacteroidota bacterium]